MITEALRSKRAKLFPKTLLKRYFIASKTYNLFKLLEKCIFYTNYWGGGGLCPCCLPPPLSIFKGAGEVNPPLPSPLKRGGLNHPAPSKKGGLTPLQLQYLVKGGGKPPSPLTPVKRGGNSPLPLGSFV